MLIILKKFKPDIVLIHSNIRHFLSFIKAFELANLNYYPRVIVISTTGIFSRFKAFSSLYKIIENKIKAYKGSYTILRPSIIYGSFRDRNISRLIKFIYKFRLSITFGNGLNKFQPVYFEDLSSAITKVVLNNKIYGEYNLTGKDCLSFNKMVKIISKTTDRKVINLKVPLFLSGIFYCSWKKH